MSEQWYYTKGDQKHGPVTAEKLKELAASGQLQPSDLIWKEGMKQWAKAELVKGLVSQRTTGRPTTTSSKKER